MKRFECPSAVSALLLFILALCGPTDSARGEWKVDLYGGVGITRPSTVRLYLPPDTDLKISRVRWRDESTKPPPYYGVRAIKWFSSWGVGLEFIHAKIIAKLDNNANLRGKLKGAYVDRDETIRNIFKDLSFTHGYNMLFFTVLNQLANNTNKPEQEFFFNPYVGAGVGVTIPHAEVKTDVLNIYKYKLGGFAVEVFLGLNFPAGRRLSLFSEYKMSIGEINIRVESAGKLETHPITHHILLGLSVFLK